MNEEHPDFVIGATMEQAKNHCGDNGWNPKIAMGYRRAAEEMRGVSGSIVELEHDYVTARGRRDWELWLRTRNVSMAKQRLRYW